MKSEPHNFTTYNEFIAEARSQIKGVLDTDERCSILKNVLEGIGFCSCCGNAPGFYNLTRKEVKAILTAQNTLHLYDELEEVFGEVFDLNDARFRNDKETQEQIKRIKQKDAYRHANAEGYERG